MFSQNTVFGANISQQTLANNNRYLNVKTAPFKPAQLKTQISNLSQSLFIGNLFKQTAEKVAPVIERQASNVLTKTSPVSQFKITHTARNFATNAGKNSSITRGTVQNDYMSRNFASTKPSGPASLRPNLRAFSTEAGKMNLSKKMGIDNIPHLIKDKRVLMRVDFNVPMKDGQVSDPKRIVATLPSINYLLENNAKSLVLMSHMGRPQGEKNEKFSLKPLVPVIEDLLKKKVIWVPDCVGTDTAKIVAGAKNGEIVLLENLRYYKAEEGKGVVNGEKVKASKEEIAAFRKQLTSYADIYVNDAFGTAHRAHSSMVGVDVPTRAAGFLMKKELDYFAKVLESPNKPLTVVMGGAKVKDKIQLIYNMLDIVDEMIIGGGMAFTFDKVLHGTRTGASLFDEEGAKTVPDIMKKAAEKGVKIHLPVDYLCADKFAENAATEVRTRNQGIQEGWLGLDIGPQSIAQNAEVIRRSQTVFWNGPQGVFEMVPFAKGSLSMLDEIIAATKRGATSVAGGGDTVALLKKVPGSAQKLSHVSTGGGASLELVEGKQLPGVVALSEKE